MAKKKKKTPSLVAALKASIKASGRSAYELGQAAEVDASVISRFMLAVDPDDRGFDIRLSTASRLADELGLSLR